MTKAGKEKHYRCPKCGDTDNLQIAILVQAKLSQSNDDPDCFETEVSGGDHEWGHDSHAACNHCAWTGKVKDCVAAPEATSLVDGEYILADGAAWFSIKGFSVRVHSTDEGVVADIFAKGKEDEGAVASTYAFDQERKDQDAEGVPQKEPMKIYRCGDCGYTTEDDNELEQVRHLSVRVAPGEPMPDGQCPKCGALVHAESNRESQHRPAQLSPFLALDAAATTLTDQYAG